MTPDRRAALVQGLTRFLANDLLDEDGRPLGEVSSPLYEAVSTEVVACPYPDGRRGKPMNRTALRQVSMVWPQVLETLRALAGAQPTVHRAWKVALVGISAPLLSALPVSRQLSAFYKASLGLSQVTSTLLLADDGVANAPFASLGGGNAFFAALDQHGWLLGQLQVCSGTRAMIEAAGEALAGSAARDAAVEPIALSDPEEVAELAAATVAAQAGWLLHADGLRARGVEIPSAPLPPWLRSVMAEARRPPEQVARFFLAGQVPQAVSGWLRAEVRSLEELEERFEELLASLVSA